jgi:hypothetical protein
MKGSFWTRGFSRGLPAKFQTSMIGGIVDT